MARLPSGGGRNRGRHRAEVFHPILLVGAGRAGWQPYLRVRAERDDDARQTCAGTPPLSNPHATARACENGRGSCDNRPLAATTTEQQSKPMGKFARTVRCAVLALAFADAGAQALDVRVASQETLEPKWIHDGGRVTGICPDIMAAIERVEPRLHFVGYRHSSRSLSGIEAGLENGSLDAACGLVSSPHRLAIGQPVGKAIYPVRHYLVVRRNDPVTIESTDDLARLGDLVTTQRASVFTERLRAAGVRVDDATDDNRVNLRKILAGHGRFAYINDLALRYLIRTEGLEDRVRVLPVVLGDEPMWFWVGRRADPALAPLLGAALDKLKASGDLDRIYVRWENMQ
jgi:glutamate/aspartate transport system substrate-binding protein